VVGYGTATRRSWSIRCGAEAGQGQDGNTPLDAATGVQLRHQRLEISEN